MSSLVIVKVGIGLAGSTPMSRSLLAPSTLALLPGASAVLLFGIDTLVSEKLARLAGLSSAVSIPSRLSAGCERVVGWV